MQQRPMKMNASQMIAATERAKAYERSLLERAERFRTDPEKVARIVACECKTCYYGGMKVGGATMTTRPCMSCGKDQMYGSTCTDVLCLACARQHVLCKHCGGDLEMKVRRKGWPEPNVKVEVKVPSEEGTMVLMPKRDG